MYTGQALFQGDTSLGMLQAIHAVIDLTDVLHAYHARKHAAIIVELSHGGTAVTLEQARMPFDLHEVVLACLCADPAERPSARQLLSYKYAPSFVCAPEHGLWVCVVCLQHTSIPFRVTDAANHLQGGKRVRHCMASTSRAIPAHVAYVQVVQVQFRAACQ